MLISLFRRRETNKAIVQLIYGFIWFFPHPPPLIFIFPIEFFDCTGNCTEYNRKDIGQRKRSNWCSLASNFLEFFVFLFILLVLLIKIPQEKKNKETITLVQNISFLGQTYFISLHKTGDLNISQTVLSESDIFLKGLIFPLFH